MPPWKTRLLEQLQNLSFRHRRELQHGYPDYDLTPSSDDLRVRVWKAHLRELDADRGEIEIRARASGIPEPMIEHARALGDQGVQWSDHQPPPEPAHGADATRQKVIEQIASDIWRLEHTAVLTAARRERLMAQGIVSEPHPIAASQLQANISALWVCAADASVGADLTDVERTQLWGRDEQGWRALVEATINRYSDTLLEQHWRTQAWPGIENDAQHRTPSLGSGGLDNAGHLPPMPHVMIDNARQALTKTAGESRPPGQASQETIAAAGLDAMTYSWADESASAHDPAPARTAPEPELER